MNRYDDDQLTWALRRQADGLPAQTVTLDSVKRTANRMRWRRRAASGAVAGVMLAVAVPVGVTALTGPQDQDPTPPVAGSPSPSRSPSSPELKERPVRVALRTGGQRIGGEPGITYMLFGNIIEPDGTMTEVGRQLADVTPFRDGWLGLGPNRAGDWLAVVVNGRGNQVDRFGSGYSLATNVDRTLTAYTRRTTAGGTLRLEGAGVQKVWTFAADANWSPVGIIGFDRVVYNDDSVKPVAMVAGPSGTRPLLGLLEAGGVSPDGLVSGMTRSTDTGSCWAVLAADTQRRLWRTCDYSLGKFSPDGRFVLGYPAYRDGIGDRQVAILDARTGRVLVDYVARNRSEIFVNTAAWEDGTHLLATVYDGGNGGWYLLRLDAKGTIVKVTRSALGDNPDNVPIVLSATP